MITQGKLMEVARRLSLIAIREIFGYALSNMNYS